MPTHRAFESIRNVIGDQFQARYTRADGHRHSAGQTFVRRSNPSAWLARAAAVGEG